MKEITKLKQQKWGLEVTKIILSLIGCILLLVIFQTTTSKEFGDRLTGLFYIGITLFLFFSWLKGKAFVVLPGMLLNGTIAVVFFLPKPAKLILGFLVVVPLLAISCYAMYIQFKNAGNQKKILELVAKSVTGTANGFTARPFPAGNIAYSKGEIIGVIIVQFV